MFKELWNQEIKDKAIKDLEHLDFLFRGLCHQEIVTNIPFFQEDNAHNRATFACLFLELQDKYFGIRELFKEILYSKCFENNYIGIAEDIHPRIIKLRYHPLINIRTSANDPFVGSLLELHKLIWNAAIILDVQVRWDNKQNEINDLAKLFEPPSSPSEDDDDEEEYNGN